MRGVPGAQPGWLSLSEEQQARLVTCQDIHQDYDVAHEPFARGKFAAVRLCKSRHSGERLAAKWLRKRPAGIAGLKPEVGHEIAVLEACRPCPHVVTLERVYDSHADTVLLMELAAGGEVQSLLDKDEILDEAEVRRLMRQILQGIAFLHQLNIVHLDIKPQNLVLTGEFPACDVKLCDLGISRFLGDGADIREILGTPDYVAPEVLNYEPISLATDMWSVGVVLYVLLSGCSPFAGDTKQETLYNISRGLLDFPEELFGDVSADAQQLMRQLMVLNPRKRLSATECLQHPWFVVSPPITPTIAVVRRELRREGSFKKPQASEGSDEDLRSALLAKAHRTTPVRLLEVPEPRASDLWRSQSFTRKPVVAEEKKTKTEPSPRKEEKQEEEKVPVKVVMVQKKEEPEAKETFKEQVKLHKTQMSWIGERPVWKLQAMEIDCDEAPTLTSTPTHQKSTLEVQLNLRPLYKATSSESLVASGTLIRQRELYKSTGNLSNAADCYTFRRVVIDGTSGDADDASVDSGMESSTSDSGLDATAGAAAVPTVVSSTSTTISSTTTTRNVWGQERTAIDFRCRELGRRQAFIVPTPRDERYRWQVSATPASQDRVVVLETRPGRHPITSQITIESIQARIRRLKAQALGRT